jgi:twitching motility protein PilU
MSVLNDLLALMVEKNASDLYLTVGAPPTLKIDGKAVAVGTETVKPGQTVALAKEILGSERLHEFEQEKEAISPSPSPTSGAFG